MSDRPTVRLAGGPADGQVVSANMPGYRWVHQVVTYRVGGGVEVTEHWYDPMTGNYLGPKVRS